MNTYFKILGYAGNIRRFIMPFAAFSLVAGVFGVLNLVLLSPLLDVLFSQLSHEEIVNLTLATPKWYDFVGQYNRFFAEYSLTAGKMGALKFVCITILIVTLISNVAKYFSIRLIEGFKANMVANLRKSVFDNTLNLQLGFFSNERKGDLISRITTDVQEVENSIANSFSAAIKELILLIAYLVALFWISWKLTLFALIVIPITAAFLAFMVKKMRTNATDSQERLSNIMSIMDETFGSMRVVKAFLAEKFIKNRFNEQNEGYKNSTFAYAAKRELASPFSEFVGVSMVSSLLFFGGSLILNDQSSLTASMFVSYIALFSQVMRPAKDISQAISTAQRGLSSADRVLELLHTETSVVDIANAISIKGFEDNIKYEHVDFNYTNERNTLKNINIEIKKGQTVALVGGSGGGKSTMADLAIRFYDVAVGQISIDGVDIRNISQSSLRRQMGIVTQEAILFNDTIFNNIAFGRETSEEQLIQAAKIANAHDFIMAQPNGYNTNIGERGSKLSGGQKQRISIARAILLNPPILILDEATSALDTESEKLVQDALQNLMKNRTTLVIAHRLSTIQSADKIYVVNHGEIVEQGNHEQLNTLEDGYYRKLVSMQEIS